MSDEAAFLRAIQADRTDATTMLVYADWLDERGEPERAEYLRLLARTSRDPSATRELEELEEHVGRSWRSWLTTSMPMWNEATFYALGKLEALLHHYEGTTLSMHQLGYCFEASLELRSADVIPAHYRATRQSVRLEQLDDWVAELSAVFQKWFFSSDADHPDDSKSEWVRRSEADKLAYALDCVRDVLRPLRGWRAHVTPSSGYYWDDIVLEAADRVLFLHFDGDD
jgi:uncharacterized protein (TIGR02996 family)